MILWICVPYGYQKKIVYIVRLFGLMKKTINIILLMQINMFRTIMNIK